MSNVLLLATESDPVGRAVSSTLADLVDFQRTEPDDFAPDELGSRSGVRNVLLIGDSGLEAAKNQGFERIKPGLVQFLGCRPPVALVDRLNGVGVVAAGISPVIAPRVANRVAGFAGPLGVQAVRGIQTDGDGPAWGIIGIGFTGTEVIRKLTSSAGSITVADIRTPRAGALADLNVRRNTLDLLVAGSDVITLHVQPGPTASPLISERELRLMKSGTVLINTSHSSVVDEEAVLDALANGPLGGYATDCPGDVVGIADESLLSSGKLVVTTNNLTNQVGAAQQIAKFVAANVQSFRDGSNIEGRIDLVDFPKIGDPGFWSSRMSPRQ
jgi:hypothetical protein